MAYLSPLTADQRTTFLVVSLPQRTLKRLVGALGTAPKGTRLEKLSAWELAWTLTDFYEADAEVAAEVDRSLLRTVGPSPLASAVATQGGGVALADLVLRAEDPLRDLAWAVLSSAPESAASLANELVAMIVAEFDDAEERAKKDEEASTAPQEEAATPDPEGVAREIDKQTKSAKRGRQRALKRADGMKGRVAEIETSLADANRALKAERSARGVAESDRRRAESERDEARSRAEKGTAGEVERLAAELAGGARRQRSLEEDLAAARAETEALSARIRDLGERKPVAASSDVVSSRPDPANWSLPIFTGEFYDSIKAWDRRVLRIAFEKIVRLAEDWRHPSLRAIPLEGLPGHYRIRIASDVRLIYRRPDGGRLEILSLIDREDLTRYIRTAKR
ncbi:MAG: hypothetical protein P8R42_27675 [Candidatus Binatia bacterium]|nr:hypothetical protein [Candidatus Binatia bacterium]